MCLNAVRLSKLLNARRMHYNVNYFYPDAEWVCNIISDFRIGDLSKELDRIRSELSDKDDKIDVLSYKVTKETRTTAAIQEEMQSQQHVCVWEYECNQIR